MTKEEFIEKEEHLWNKYKRLKQKSEQAWEDRKALQEAYAKEVLDASGYTLGQKVIDTEGRPWYVSGAFTMDGDVYLNFNFAKKDGTMSKVSGMGRGMPEIQIK